MKFKSILILFSIINSFGLIAQDLEKRMEGTVSFVTSSNVYVKFDSTEDIEIGKILKFSDTDCLRVTDKSSTSVVCSIIDNCLIKKGDIVIYLLVSEENIETIIEPDEKEVIPIETVENDSIILNKEPIYSEKIRGRISVGSYNSFSNLREDRHRIMTRFSMNADHISDSKFSLQSYLAYRNIITPSGSRYRGRTSVFNVYNLNLKYDASPSLSLTAGRKINSKASSTGAIDGLQVEKYFGNFYVGGIGGFRPDFSDYGFNSKLLQYGGYVGLETVSENFSSQTTLGAMEQTNSGSTDRRFVYFQHNSTIASKLNLFGSLELDIFGKDNNDTRLTNLYLSTRYRFNKAVNIMVSYDSRKRIIYYETYESEIENILDDDLARQGIRARLNVRPFKMIWAGISYSNRFQSDDKNKSDNIYGYLTLTKIPKIGGRLNVSYNMNTNNYLTSNIYSIRHSRDLVKSKLYADFSFRQANYAYEDSNRDFIQDYYGIVLNYRISRTWQFSISGEYSQLNDDNNYRFYSRLIKRFYSKKKNKR